jgi:hypothetical protein
MKELVKTLCVVFVLVFATAINAFAQEPDQVSSGFLSNAGDKSGAVAPRGHRNGQGHANGTPTSTR